MMIESALEFHDFEEGRPFYRVHDVTQGYARSIQTKFNNPL